METSATMETERSSLGDFLRSRRKRLSPETLGISSLRRRRTAGLRREEVAELAGIGVDWYVRLEQGRMVRPSPTTVDALARALKLDGAEHAHLRALADRTTGSSFIPEKVSEGLRRVVESLDQPAFVKGARWDILAWNARAAEIFTDFASLKGEDRNVVSFMFTSPEARRLFGDGWAEEARHVLAQFRRSHDHRAGDPAFQRLIERMSATSAEFDGWWRAHDVRSTATGRKQLHLRDGRAATYDYATFQPCEDTSLRLVIYSSA